MSFVERSIICVPISEGPLSEGPLYCITTIIRLLVLDCGYFSTEIVGLLPEILPSVVAASHSTSHSNITWDKPFTLDITDVDPDIIGYTVCISVRDVQECGNVTATEVIVPKYYFDVNIMITAWNIVGESPAALYSIIPCTDEIQSKLYMLPQRL